ncbi:MAG: hypothetical protein Q4B79_09200 [Moraxella sp.]|uniref:hypothetical protein n=1 Tax=Moraxella sp. TaxID=479 RepID=UPI0026DD8348|nr:hypothetical protein [Moraxella sp.]MDO4451116.1 hypothetical protein [Moraxella sp.]
MAKSENNITSRLCYWDSTSCACEILVAAFLARASALTPFLSARNQRLTAR